MSLITLIITNAYNLLFLIYIPSIITLQYKFDSQMMKLSIFIFIIFSPVFGLKEYKISFPKGFIIGAASASYQVEGGWNISGKGENIWDRKVHTDPSYILDGNNGDIASDSYHKYKEDVQYLKYIGFKMYRFSLSWTRILPDGTVKKINQPGVQYYHDLIDELLKNGIEPMVTLHHWDVPQYLQEFGGWLNSSMVDYFLDFAHLAFSRYGRKVKWWITINEPSILVMGYGSKDFAPALNLHGTGEYIAGHNMIKAHARAYKLYHAKFKDQGGKVSLAVNINACFPKNPKSKDDIDASDRAFQFMFGWFAHPVYSEMGDYPTIMRKTIDENSANENLTESRLPKFTHKEINDIKGTFDYLALNHYSSKLCSNGFNGTKPSWFQDQNVTYDIDEKWPQSKSSWLQIVPEGFRKNINEVKNEYGNLKIFIAENGYSDDNVTDDSWRIYYFYNYMKQMLLAMELDKCNVIGYTAWSLLDNFEWKSGYTESFGIIQVDFNHPNRTRKLKKSALFFKKILTEHNQQNEIN